MVTQSIFASYVVERTQTLARVFLTRQPEVKVTTVDLLDFDFLVHVLPSEKGSRNATPAFGAILWGTSQELATEEQATRHANQRWKNKRAMSGYYMPVLLLLYSMEGDTGYYSWACEPSMPPDEEIPRLLRPEKLACKMVRQRSLHDVLETVHDWYSALGRIVYDQR